jgi:hypothetical protein
MSQALSSVRIIDMTRNQAGLALVSCRADTRR